jgi:hypothetical protein
MSTTRSAIPPAGVSRRPWEAPLLSELSLRAATKSSYEPGPEPKHPDPPVPAMAKLGFSLELGFPLASRSDK